MAKNRKPDSEWAEIIDLEAGRRAAKREKKQQSRRPPEKTGWREDLRESRGVVPHVRERADTEAKREEKKGRARAAALYSDLRTEYEAGRLTREEIQKYLEDSPGEAEYQAYAELLEAIKTDAINQEIEELKTKLGGETEKTKKRRTIVQKLRKRVKGKWIEETVKVPVEMGKGAAAIVSPEAGKVEWSEEEWYDFLLRQYAAGELDVKKIEKFLETYPEGFKEAHQKLLTEIRAEREISPEGKLSQKEVEDMLLRGLKFKEEFINDIPTQEGKTVFEEMLEEQLEEFKQILRDTISRAEIEKRTAELNGDGEKAERALIREAAKKFLASRELVTHHLLGYDEKRGWGLGRYSDLDGRCAVALAGRADIDIKHGTYVPPGDFKKGAINFDTSNKDGMDFDSEETVDPETGERKIVITTTFDHHGPHSHRGTSTTGVFYEKVLNEFGLIKFESEEERQAYDKLVEFVTQMDNFNYPNMEKYFTTAIAGRPETETTHRMLLGLRRFVPFEKLLQFFKDGKSPTDALSDKELEKYGLRYYDKRAGKTVDRSVERREIINKTLAQVREAGGQGWMFVAGDGKKILIDMGGKMGGEMQWAAASLGYDGVIRYNPETHGFFVALNKGEFDPEIFQDLPQGKLIRKSVFMQPLGQEKLVVTLGDLIKRLAPDFKPGPKTELKRFLDREPWRIRAIVSQAPEGWWWTNAPDGKKVVVRGLPMDFKSGSEAYLVLKRPREVSEEEINKYGGDFYVGYFESEEIPKPAQPKKEVAPPKPEVEAVLPKPEKKELTPEEARRKEIEEIIRKAIAVLRGKMFDETVRLLEKSPAYREWSPEKRKDFARQQVEVRIKLAEGELRKKYGL